MRERLSVAKSWSGRKFGAMMLSASALLSNEQVTSIERPVQPTHRVNVSSGIDRSLLAAAIRDPATGEPTIIVDTLPPATDAGFKKGLQEPLVRLSLHEGTTTFVAIKPDSAREDKKENGEFDGSDGSVTLYVHQGASMNEGLFSNPDILPFALDHENTHALNYAWWDKLSKALYIDDPLLRQKVDRVATTCATINKTIFEQFVIADRDGLIKAYNDAGGAELPRDDLNNIRLNNAHDAMVASAQAVESGVPTIFTAPQHMNASCESPSVFSIPLSLAQGPMKLPNTPDMFKRIIDAEIALKSDERRTFACLKEGAGIAVRINDYSAFGAGHPEDNPTEAASSIVSSLVANPEYFGKCLDRLEPADKAALEAYASAELDLMNYVHPQIIAILRENPEAASIVDRLLAIDR